MNYIELRSNKVYLVSPKLPCVRQAIFVGLLPLLYPYLSLSLPLVHELRLLSLQLPSA